MEGARERVVTTAEVPWAVCRFASHQVLNSVMSYVISQSFVQNILVISQSETRKEIGCQRRRKPDNFCLRNS